MKSFDERTTFLFVGPYMVRKHRTAIRCVIFAVKCGREFIAKPARRMVIAGAGTDYYLNDLAGDDIQVLGSVVDLAPLYNSARVVVVPTRYAAGIPYKAHEAPSFGVPMVV
jgi:O-antigen biosynthesis protein